MDPYLDLLLDAFSVLSNQGITFGVVGEIALNYYNVPRVVHDFEICLASSALHLAVLHLEGMYSLQPSPIDDDDFNIYTEYKRGCPRFEGATTETETFKLLLIPDAKFGLSLSAGSLVTGAANPTPRAFYSEEITSWIPRRTISDLPFLRLPALVAGLSFRWFQEKDDMSRIGLEQLVDGMDLDEQWVERNASQEASDLMRLLVSQKPFRLDHFRGNLVTAYKPDLDTAQKVRKIAGYE